MNMAPIRFDDPGDLSEFSRIFVDLSMRLMALDYARRRLERIGDKSSEKRAGEIRKFYKQAILDSVYLVRAIIPEDMIHEHSKMQTERAFRVEKERKKSR